MKAPILKTTLASLVLLLVSTSVAMAQVERHGPHLKRKLVKMVLCLKVPTTKLNHTGLSCGIDAKEEAQILDIPETIYQFLKGEVFRMYVYSDGEEFPPNDQPKGSKVIRTPPCPKNPQGYRIPAAQAPPCNPEIN